MIYEHVKAICTKFVSPLVGVISSLKYSNISAKRFDNLKKTVENKTEVVVLPIEYSIEHYKDKKNPIASYCRYHSIKVNSENSDSTYNISIGYKCEQRCKILKFYTENDKVFVDIELLDIQEFKDEHNELKNSILENFKEYLKFDTVSIGEIEDVKNAENIDKFIRAVILACKFDVSVKRTLTETEDATERLIILDYGLESRLYEIRSDKDGDIINYYKNKINQLKINPEIKQLIFNEFVRLKTTNKHNSEFGNIVDWLDRVLSLPWNTEKKENDDVILARDILNESHYGMQKLKDRISEYISLKIISNKTPSSIICLYGPPGVGKSTIARAIAKALNKDFYGFSLGGVSNPEEINGMKRFYIGAKPGRIMEGITQAGSNNCVLLLDEIDKMRSDGNRGDPYAVLLDVLDKNQNKEYKDKYFDIPFDLSKVMFIATANSLDTIPEPVLNRLEILSIEGYSLNEKVHIAHEYIIKKVLEDLGITDINLIISDDNLKMIIEDYTFESGVRQLERAIENICKKALIERHKNNSSESDIVITESKIKEYLGDYHTERFNSALEGEIGVVNKMSIHGPAGDLSRLEVSLVKGSGEIILSDNLIGTAKSTFKTVFGLLMSKAQEWNIDTTVFETMDFYIHSAHHIIKCDGPSGGIADIVCIISAIKKIPVNHKYAFTGEISLKGKVLAIGGIKEKLLAAQMNKMETVIIPLQNKPDVEKLSKEIIGNLNIKYVNDIDDVYKVVFENNN